MTIELDSALVDRATAGDIESLKLLLTLARPMVREFIERRLPTDAAGHYDADDVVQEAYADAFQKIKTFQHRDSTAFQRWLLTIALNRLRDAKRHFRAAKRRARLVNNLDLNFDSSILLLESLVGPGKTPSSCAARTEASLELQRAISGLPEDYRQAVLMVHIEGRPVREVAETMQRTQRAIHGLCRRALRQLQAELQSASRFLAAKT